MGLDCSLVQLMLELRLLLPPCFGPDFSCCHVATATRSAYGLPQLADTHHPEVLCGSAALAYSVSVTSRMANGQTIVCTLTQAYSRLAGMICTVFQMKSGAVLAENVITENPSMLQQNT